MRKTTAVGAVFLAVAATFLLVPAGNMEPPGAPAPTMKTLMEVEPRSPISSVPFTVGSSESYYVTQNLIGSSGQDGITIDADDVTIDLNGFALIGVAGSLSGIRANGATRYSLEVKNGIVSNWGANGILFPSAHNSVVKDIRAMSNLAGGFLLGPTTIITQCIAQQNGVDGSHAGIASSDSTGSIVDSCVSRANTGNGIGTTSNAIVRNNFVYDNGWEGIAVGNVNLVVNNVSKGNPIGAGIRTAQPGNRIE